jgi:hypothetical protein
MYIPHKYHCMPPAPLPGLPGGGALFNASKSSLTVSFLVASDNFDDVVDNETAA